MKRLCLLPFLLLLLPLCSPAQFSKIEYYNSIDNKIFLFSKKDKQSFDSVTAFVNKNFSKTEDRVRAYYTWTALNVSYDTKRLRDLEIMSIYNVNGSNNFSQVADTVFKRKTGVCEGISNLMVKFCAASSIPCEKVLGYTKMPDGVVSTDILHVWNFVKIDSTLGLLDVTWSNGYIDPKGNLVKKFSDKYFLSRPESFIKDHLPLDPMWQLLNSPVNRSGFAADSLVPGIEKKYNYRDSIHAYLKLPKEEREYTDYLHYYQTDTSSKIFASNLDIFINNSAASELISSSIYYDDYVYFHNNTLVKKPTKTNFKKAREMLLNCSRNHKSVNRLLLKSRANTSEYREIFVKMNEAVISQQKQVDEQLAYLKKAEKGLKK
ncbi:MAG: transglutaminase domain protein [Bacteroidetes bacterium]|jgi:hypothetical protein|nr:transglutaminase domain protein [Bacteroidota bacterium]